MRPPWATDTIRIEKARRWLKDSWAPASCALRSQLHGAFSYTKDVAYPNSNWTFSGSSVGAIFSRRHLQLWLRTELTWLAILLRITSGNEIDFDLADYLTSWWTIQQYRCALHRRHPPAVAFMRAAAARLRPEPIIANQDGVTAKSRSAAQSTRVQSAAITRLSAMCERLWHHELPLARRHDGDALAFDGRRLPKGHASVSSPRRAARSTCFTITRKPKAP